LVYHRAKGGEVQPHVEVRRMRVGSLRRVKSAFGRTGASPGFEAQHDQIWQNTLAVLGDAGMGAEDFVRLNLYSTYPDGLKYVMAHRKKYLNPGHTPASTWVVTKIKSALTSLRQDAADLEGGGKRGAPIALAWSGA
jgi:hypothetical protein